MDYAELLTCSNFTFLKGASHPDELVERAAELGLAAVAITDEAGVAGIVRAHVRAKEMGIKLIVGSTIRPTDGPPIVLWCLNRTGYANLCRLITTGRRRTEKGKYFLRLDDVERHADGLAAGVLVEEDETTVDPHTYRRIGHVFRDRAYLAGALYYGGDDRRRIRRFQDIAEFTGLPLVAVGDVLYHTPHRRRLCEVLHAIRRGKTVADLGEDLLRNSQRFLRSAKEMYELWFPEPRALRRSVEIAERVEFSLDELRYEYPEEVVPPGETPMSYLRRLTERGVAQRYPDGVPERVRRLLDHEYALIEELRYEAYFLTVWDLVRFARERGILCQGRGSAANSAVCYCLGITAVDPARMDLLFERFVSRERDEAPDIDVDFEHHRREEVLQYIYRKYGRDRAGITAEVITYRSRSAVREAGKALGFTLDEVDRIAKKIEHFHEEPDLEQRCREAGIDPHNRRTMLLVESARELIGFPRHLSQHTGGMVITRSPLCELVPLENAAMPDRTVIQWNKDDIDELGILKVDCLCLGMLTAVHKTLDAIAEAYRQKYTPATIPAEDPKVYEMIGRADTMGVFQIESRAQMSMLPRLRPKCFYDLVIEVAIVRPGPIQGDMVHPYLRRRNGEEEVVYPNEAVKAVLEKTLGVPLFQEQAMRLAMIAAGFSAGEADQLRRAMGAWRRPGLIDAFRRRLIDGMKQNGFDEEYAETVFRQIRGFGEYGFPESHAASFALLVYVSAWLKCHYPEAFLVGLLNSQPMGFYAPAQLIADARRHGVTVLPVDVNRSDWESTLERPPSADGGHGKGSTALPNAAGGKARCAVRLGLQRIAGLQRRHAECLLDERRKNGPFRDAVQLARRTRLPRHVLERLAKSGAMDSLGGNRRRALWQVLEVDRKETPLLDRVEDLVHRPEETVFETLPSMTELEEILADYRTTGHSLRGHPLAHIREALNRLRVVPASQLAEMNDGAVVRVAGIVLVRQRPGTAKGITFMTLEDESGIVNLVVRPQVWRRWRTAALEATALLAAGRLQIQQQVIHVVAWRLEDLSCALQGLPPRSRNFC